MLDYRAIAALHAVIETQGFEAAAQKLFITQSAVSQRIQSLENHFGKPVLIRSQPYEPTELGKTLLGHYKQLMFLETCLHSEMSMAVEAPTISVAISRDSLETWFGKVMEKFSALSADIKLEIIADDQEMTLDYLKKGLVSACASSIAKPINGCQAEFIGFFDYVLVASPAFIKKHFSNHKNINTRLINAPSIIFDHKDDLHARYLEKFFKIAKSQLNHHVVPSVTGFRQFALKGYAYALIPEIDIKKELIQKKLINLFPDKVWQMPVYWHSWAIENKKHKAFNALVKQVTSNILRQA